MKPGRNAIISIDNLEDETVALIAPKRNDLRGLPAKVRQFEGVVTAFYDGVNVNVIINPGMFAHVRDLIQRSTGYRLEEPKL